MEIKDYFYIIGILLTFLIGILNFFLAKNNRKNSMQEHIFKEQVKVVSRLFVQLNEFNKIIDNLYLNSLKTSDIDFIKEMGIIEKIIYENQFILTNDILSLLMNVMDKATEFYNSVVSSEKHKDLMHTNYYKEYDKFLMRVRMSFGIDYLTQENQRLHKSKVQIKL